MNISPMQNPIQNTKRISTTLDKAMEIIPNTKVAKNLTILDKYAFQQYCFALNNKTRVTKEELDSLFAKDGKDFIDSTYNFLLKKMNIDDSIKPVLIYTEKSISSDLAMGYSPTNNVIQVPISTIQGNSSKPQLYGYLRHELQHFKQNCDVLRCSEISDKAIETYTEQLAKTERDYFKHILNRCSVDEILELKLNKVLEIN